MDTQYFLRQHAIDAVKREPLTEEEFQSLKQARAILSDALDFEQRYELLVRNFVSLELAVTELSLKTSLENSYEYPELAKILQESNRHWANLMSAAKSYIDQVRRDFKLLAMVPSFAESVEALLSAEYDDSVEYRFMEALRNYTQHRAFPVTGFSSSMVSAAPNDWVDHLKVTAKKKELFSDSKFKTKFLDQLPEVIDLRAMSREYVRRIGRTHVALRKLVDGNVSEARLLVEAAIERYSHGGEASTVGLNAFKVGDSEETVSVFTDWDDVRVKLALKNAYPPDLVPRPRGDEPTAAKLRELREACGLSVQKAARLVEVQPELWEHYESGLRIPFSIYTLFLLQTEQHPSHMLKKKDQCED